MNAVKKFGNLKILASLFFVLTFVVNCFQLEIWADEVFATFSNEPGKYVINTKEGINNYLYDKYSEYKNVEINDVIYHNPLNTYNFSQDTLNKEYNKRSDKHFNINVSGSCSEVAILIVNEYMLRKSIISENGIVQNENTLFYRICGAAKDNGWNGNGGTKEDKIDDIFTDAMKFYTPKYKGDYSILNMHKKFMDSYYSGIPVIVSAPEHSMCACGILEKNVTYTKKGLFGIETTKTELETFLIVNDGWYDATIDNFSQKYSYIPFEIVSSIVVPILI